MSEQSEKLPPHQYQRFLRSLPTDWGRKEIRQLGTVVGGGTPSRDVPSFWRGAIPWVTPGELSGNATKFLQDTNERISASGLAESGANLLPAGSLMVTTRATLGARAINAVPMATNQGFKSILFKDAADAEFYFHLFEKVQPELVRRASGTTFLEISAAEFSCIEVPSPSSSEKCLITKVLDTLDTAIHETEAIIAKLKAVKQGLLHDLLTRGIDTNGELRPPQTEAPHLYKQSPLGWIPKEWTYKPFGDLCESSAFGPRFPSDAYDESGPLATLRTTDMDDEGNISLSTMPRAAIAPSVFADHLLRPGDLVISRSGTCGVTGVFAGHDIPVVPGAFLIRFRMRDIRLNRFYRRYFNSSQGRPYLDRLAVGGVQKNIKGSDVLCLLVPVPSPEEAIGIAERIEFIEHDIESNQQLLTKLTLQKSGLIDDLLTGRVRVTPLLDQAE
ncbi:restriction endonuclease subunit S [Bordetella bronchiseptica]|uniref:restriction endonuclease subunit S n=1 Tax=Bordetella bronchiseptica TaxID=518 RepID=UPI0002EF8B7E|nr:restriction endonuclease subunit S [Bordetella bronchiseptica]KAB1446374.1 restriction endonuclease subunit S [Bordetella bronchiseptica]KAB1572822.1 restriction endonuclease subunit S [Bordetella bronchiseptica]